MSALGLRFLDCVHSFLVHFARNDGALWVAVGGAKSRNLQRFCNYSFIQLINYSVIVFCSFGVVLSLIIQPNTNICTKQPLFTATSFAFQ
jgi:hypothetical protein